MGETRSTLEAARAKTSVHAVRRRGRPALMNRDALLERIRLIARDGGLFRIHRTHGGLYARARRQFGSWADAVRAAGLDYVGAVVVARQRSIETRRRKRRRELRLDR
jgi:hypothetical protein